MQTPLMKIRNNNAVECDLNVFERDLNKVKIGNRVLLSLTNQPGVKVSGHVYGMNEYFNQGTKSIAVHVKLDATRGTNLFDGMYVSGQIATGRQLCVALPNKAIVNIEGKVYSYSELNISMILSLRDFKETTCVLEVSGLGGWSFL